MPLVREVLVVALGGAIGASMRYGLTHATAEPGGFPTATLAVNLVGAFALALMTFWLAALGPDAGRRRSTRLFLGTGVLGGFTTYSLVAVELSGFVLTEDWGRLAAYAGLTLVGGAIASFVGIIAGERIGSRAARRRETRA